MKTIIHLFVFCIFLQLEGGYDYSKLVNAIINAHSPEIEKKYNLKVCGQGGALGYDVEGVNIDYFSNKRLSIEEIRRMYIGIAESYIEKFNSNNNKTIRPYLKNYPFNIKNLRVTIGFLNPQGHLWEDGSIAYICPGNGNELFYCNQPDGKVLKEIYCEKYQNALEIVKNEKAQQQVQAYEN